MENNARFKTSLFGFNKNDVYEFIEGQYRSFDEKLKHKEEEISYLNKQISILRQQVSDLQDKLAGVDDYKANIADVLLRAKEQGEEIVKEAIRQAEDKRREIEKEAEKEKEKAETFKEELRLLREGTIDILDKYKRALDTIVDDRAEEDTQ